MSGVDVPQDLLCEIKFSVEHGQDPDIEDSVLLRKLVSTLIRSTQSLEIWNNYVELTQ
jgi:hypothetical protein